jgi:hypothetical protein
MPYEMIRNLAPRAKFFIDLVKIDKEARKELVRLKELRDAAYQKLDPEGKLPFYDALYTYRQQPVDPSHVPKSAKLKPDCAKKLSHINNLEGFFMVSKTVKEIIDTLGDPKLKFFEFEFLSETESYPYYICQIEPVFELIDRPRSGFNRNVRPDGSVYYTSLPDPKPIYIHRSLVGDRHLWTGDGLGMCFVSDELGPLIKPYMPRGFHLVEVGWS